MRRAKKRTCSDAHAHTPAEAVQFRVPTLALGRRARPAGVTSLSAIVADAPSAPADAPL